MGTTKSVGCFPLCAHRRMLEGVGRRVDPRAAWNALHVEETEMKMPGFHHLRERISHLTPTALATAIRVGSLLWILELVRREVHASRTRRVTADP